MSFKDKNGKEKEMENDQTLMSSKDENEKQNKLLNNDNNANAKNKKKTVPKKRQIKKKMRMKIFCWNVWETLMINCLKNTGMVKILTVF